MGSLCFLLSRCDTGHLCTCQYVFPPYRLIQGAVVPSDNSLEDRITNQTSIISVILGEGILVKGLAIGFDARIFLKECFPFA